MLQIKNIHKVYRSEDVETHALDGVSVDFRENEFVSVLGPSGSGKTTLLNIVGGLDHYDSGDLIIDGVSTKEYRSRDWDAYRNHRIGFVFQSYNLISHQTILSNVELALTLSGVSGAEKRKRAEEALKAVGLGAHMDKRPSQLSGGQMQRVAIARAIINNPDIILADEPTGALDSKTSVQIMDLLKKIAKDKLVVMVTHNPDLAKKYSTRIISFKDGKIVDDTNPFDAKKEQASEKKLKYTSMSLLTALNLSKNNLLTKRGRTVLTAIAGSIGIIGIALVLSLANGLNAYTKDIATAGSMASAITVEKTYLSDELGGPVATSNSGNNEAVKDGQVGITDDVITNYNVNKQRRIRRNDTAKLKAYIEEHKSELGDKLETVSYDYGIKPNIIDQTASGKTITINPIAGSDNELADLLSGASNKSVEVSEKDFIKESFKELVSTIPFTLTDGTYPSSVNELLLVTDQDGKIPLSVAYAANLVDRDNLDSFVNKINHGGDLQATNISLDYGKIVGKTYQLVLSESKEELKIVGIAKAKADGDDKNFVAYMPALTEKVMNDTNKGQDAPEKISLYAKDNESKKDVKDFLDKYNNQAEDASKVKYSDTTQELINAMSSIINIISGIIIGFVAISLVVSSIMIGIITYISVLERTKEIGILRAIGASKRDVVRVFRAETIIEGFIAGLIGTVVAWLLCCGINVVIGLFNKSLGNIAQFSIIQALVLILISIGLTVFAGSSPAKRASRKDPVEALRSE